MIVDALGRGQQVLILRKGGIIEDKGQFTVDHEQFWLFPTLFHQQMESVIADAQKDMSRFQTQFQADGNVQIQFYVRATKVIECADLAKVMNLSGLHIWKDAVIRDRFHYSKKNGIHLILTRVYRLPQPVTMPLLPTYGGCKSWVELESALPTTELKPVLSDAEYESKAAKALAAVS